MIPDEAVETAAHGLALQAWGDWEYVPDELRRLFRRDARIALEAALPQLLASMQERLADAYDEGLEAGEGRRPRGNPYI